jgi:hypothetical protein
MIFEKWIDISEETLLGCLCHRLVTSGRASQDYLTTTTNGYRIHQNLLCEIIDCYGSSLFQDELTSYDDILTYTVNSLSIHVK